MPPCDAPPSAEALARAAYVSLATSRKSGEPVATPVWCAADGANFYFFSEGSAGRVERLRV